MHPLTKEIRTFLTEHADPERVRGAQRYFKEGFKGYGITQARVQDFVNRTLRSLKSPLNLAEILIVAEELFRSRMYEEAVSAFILLEKYKKQFKGETLNLFSQWIDKYDENWATNDSFCIKVVYHCFMNYPELSPELTKWTMSQNRWMRRAACVVLVKLVLKSDEFRTQGFQMAETLLDDRDEMVQKGVGWLLKELSRRDRKSVMDFLKEHYCQVPRLVLRYATERMNREQRKRVLKGDFN